MSAVEADDGLNDTTRWMTRANCAGMDPALFFGPVGQGGQTSLQNALEVCKGCEVTDECLELALRENIREGVFGGTTPRGRRVLRREWLAERRETA